MRLRPSRLELLPRRRSHLMPVIVEAVRAYATLGEVNRALKDVFGEHKEPVKF
jgi:methylmalonyl-CoA mutase N-terminal domain/subunit